MLGDRKVEQIARQRADGGPDRGILKRQRPELQGQHVSAVVDGGAPQANQQEEGPLTGRPAFGVGREGELPVQPPGGAGGAEEGHDPGAVGIDGQQFDEGR